MQGAQRGQNQGQVRKGPIIAIMMVGAFVSVMNQTSMNTALAPIMLDLRITESTAQWLTTGYMLTNGVLIPVTAYLIERFTTRHLFLMAMGLFSLGTLICGLSPNFTILMTGRVIQASGAGIMMPLIMNVVLAMYPLNQRGKAMGYIGIGISFGPALGPTLTGWILMNHSWRLVYFIFLPIALISVIVGLFVLRNVTEQTFPKLDLTSIMLSTLGFGGTLYGFSAAGNNGWQSPDVIFGFIIGGITLILFLWRQLVSNVPMLELRVFKYPMFTISGIINAIVTMAVFAGMVLVPIYLQNMRDFSPMEAGLLVLPGAILTGIMSPISGIIFDKIGARWLAITGLGVMGAATYGFSTMTAVTSYTVVIFLYTIRMFGMSLISMPIMTAGLNQLPQHLHSHGSAMMNTLRMLSGSIGTSILITVMAIHKKDYFHKMLAAGNISFPQSIDNITSSAAQESLTKLSPALQNQIITIYNHASIKGLNDAFIIATLFAIGGLILSFFLKNVTAPKEDKKKREEGEF